MCKFFRIGGAGRKTGSLGPISTENNCENIVTKSKNISNSEKKLVNETKKLTKDVKNEIKDLNLNNYIKLAINISFLTNKYINDKEPWKLKKSNIEEMNNILHNLND